MFFHNTAAPSYKVCIQNVIVFFFFKTLLLRWLRFFITKQHLDIKFAYKMLDCYFWFCFSDGSLYFFITQGLVNVNSSIVQ